MLPLTATVNEEAPEEAIVISPELLPLPVGTYCAYMVVLATVPPDCVSVTLVVKPEPLVVDTLKLVGAVTVMSFVRLVPETMKLNSLLTEPTAVALNAEREAVLDTSVGTAAVVTELLGIETVFVAAPELESETLNPL